MKYFKITYQKIITKSKIVKAKNYKSAINKIPKNYTLYNCDFGEIGYHFINGKKIKCFIIGGFSKK